MKNTPPANGTDATPSTSPPPVIRLSDTRISQREVAAMLNVSFPTASRYMNAGRHGIRIPSAKVGGKRTTTREAVAWWFEAVQEAGAVQDASRNL